MAVYKFPVALKLAVLVPLWATIKWGFTKETNEIDYTSLSFSFKIEKLTFKPFLYIYYFYDEIYDGMYTINTSLVSYHIYTVDNIRIILVFNYFPPQLL